MPDTFHIRVIQNFQAEGYYTDFIIASYGHVYGRLYAKNRKERLPSLVRELRKIKRDHSSELTLMMVSLPRMYEEEEPFLQWLRGKESHIWFRFYRYPGEEEHRSEWKGLYKPPLMDAEEIEMMDNWLERRSMREAYDRGEPVPDEFRKEFEADDAEDKARDDAWEKAQGDKDD